MDPPVAYEPLNSLILYGTDKDIAQFINLVKLLDQKPRQVIIEMQFVEMTITDVKALGIDWFWASGNFTVDASGFAPGGNVTLRYAKGQEFRALLSTLLSKSRARLVQAPKIATMNNIPALLALSTQFPFVNFGAITGELGQVVTTAVVDIFPVVTSFYITPRINADDSITAYFTPSISDVTGTVDVPLPSGAGGGTNTVPLVSTRTLSVLLRVKDGETMVIGGFVRSQESVNRSKVPILGDLPILGPLLFTRTNRNVSDNELLIFVTPHIIREEEAKVTLGPM